MARYRITYTLDGAPQERTVSAESRDAAIRIVQLEAEGSCAAIEITSARKVAELAADNGAPAAKPEGGNGRGRARVAGVVRGKLAHLELATRQGKPVWPPKGGSHEGMRPGEWRTKGARDETGCLPHDCPVKPLGYDGESFYFVDTMGQVFNTQGKAVGVERLQILFAGQEDFLCWAWPRFSAKGAVESFKTEDARRDLYAAIARRGPWSMTDMVRGRGAWRASDGRLVLHCGERLMVGRALSETGEVDGLFYPRRPATAEPWPEPVETPEDNPAVDLVEALRTWNFVRGDIDVILLMGWLAVALMGGALDWRPSAFIVGDAGTGKSELHKLLKAVLGRSMISTTNATEAGLYQLVGHDSLPICIDELEGEDGQAQARKIINMARDAASGSIRIRGGADHKGVEFSARSTFLFSAINPPPLPPASLTRLAVLQLRALADHGKAVPVIEAAETIAPKLLRRIVDHWGDFPGLLEAYRTSLRTVGRHDSRGQQTFGHFLAGAHLLLGDEGMDAAGLPTRDGKRVADHYAIMLAADVVPELEGKQANWLRCLEAILTARPEVWRSGERQSVGQVLDRLDRGEDPSWVRNQLAQADLGLIDPGRGGHGYLLAIPQASKTLGKMLADTSYGSTSGEGNWSYALRQAPDTIVRRTYVNARGRDDNRLRIAGWQHRCLFVDLAALRRWQQAETAEERESA